MAVKDIDSLTIEDIKPVTISFKKTEDELILLKWILNHSNYSGFVKDTLRAVMNGSQSTDSRKECNRDSENLIELDF